MNTQQPGNAIDVARQNIAAYKGELLASLPSHLTDKGVGWLTSALSALRKNDFLLKMANQNPGSLIVALSEAAQLGLMPGTQEYWLTPKAGAVLGVIGYVGHVELMYRAGAVSSVIVENVYEHDKFQWNPGTMTKPLHEIDWFGADRGKVIGAYAYAIMKDGAVSKVVVVNKTRIDRAMEASASASSGKNSPWKSDYAAMVLKTAAHDLAKWVPTSAEYRNTVTATAPVEVSATTVPETPAPAPQPVPVPESAENVDTVTGELMDEGEYDPTMDAAWGQPA
jgi:recombination protein RecT